MSNFGWRKARAVISFARETWRNDGAEGETVHVLADAVEHLQHERMILRAALGEVVHAADEMLSGGEIAIRHVEQCSECGIGGVGPLRAALHKARGLVRVPSNGATTKETQG